MTENRNRLDYWIGETRQSLPDDAWIEEGKSGIVGPGRSPGKVLVRISLLAEVDAQDALRMKGEK